MEWADWLEDGIPCSPSDTVDWPRTESFFEGLPFTEMSTTPQNPEFHGENDVYTHTGMVCGELIRNCDFFGLPDRQRTELFLAALLHDLGKVKTTRKENGKWISPHHASVGSHIVREFLCRNKGLGGTPESIRFRETICTLIQYHMRPLHLIKQEEPGREARRIASVGELLPDFSWKLLGMLAEADMKGRIADDVPEGLTQIRLSRMTAEECGCLDGSYLFQDDYTKHAYLNGRNVQPDQSLFDDTWGEVILMSGLPGTGKDYWIQHQAPDCPVISLDGIRKELRIGPEEEQGPVIRLAQERAREQLRIRQPFILNATNLTKETRKKWVNLFERYGANVRIVYLETDWQIRQKRNRNREAEVPEKEVEKMLGKMSLPMPEEARKVEWICT